MKMIRKKLGPPVASWGVLFYLIVIPGLAMGAGGISGSVHTRGVKNPTDVIVYVEKVEGQFQSPKAPVQIDQIKLTYIPHVLAVLVGSEVEFLNGDEIVASRYACRLLVQPRRACVRDLGVKFGDPQLALLSHL